MSSWIDFEERGQKRDYQWALALFLLAMLCKITMTVFPFVILLYAWWRRGRIGWNDLRASLPFFAISLVLGCMTIWADHRYDESGHNLFEAVLPDNFLSRIVIAGRCLAFYFSRAFLPIDYLPAYPKAPVDPYSFLEYLPWFILVVGLLWLWSKRDGWGRHALLGTGFFILMLAPFLGLLSLKYMSFTWVLDHFLYLPIIGLIGLLVAALGDIETKFSAKRSYVAGFITVTAALMAIESHAFAALFTNDETLWTYAVQRDPGSWLAQNNLGADLASREQYADAISHYREVLRLKPGYGEGHSNLGVSLDKIGQSAAAQEQYQEALKLNPRNGKIYLELADSLLKSGRREEAIIQYEQAVRLIPDFAPLRYNYGSLLLSSGQLPGAIEQLQAAVKLDSGLAQGHENLGSALAQSGRVPEAIGQFQTAVHLQPDYLIARNNLALALAQSGRVPEATAQFQQVLQIDPANAAANAGLARIQGEESAGVLENRK